MTESGPVLHSAALFPAVLDSIPVPVIVHDYETILYANRAALGVLRAGEHSDVVGQPADRFTHDQSRDSGEERRRLVMDHHVWLRNVHVKMTALDGIELELTVDAGAIVVEDSPAIMVVGRSVRGI